jgi:hypothetical protein
MLIGSSAQYMDGGSARWLSLPEQEFSAAAEDFLPTLLRRTKVKAEL